MSINDASVVDLPGTGRTGHEDQAAREVRPRLDDRRNAERVEVDDLVRNRAHHTSDRVPLHEDIHAEATLAGKRVRRIQLEVVLELLALLLRDDGVHHLADLRAVQRRQMRHGVKIAVHADDRRRACSQVQVGAAVLEHELEQVVDVEFVAEVLARRFGADPDSGGLRHLLGPMLEAVDHLDRALKFYAVRDRRDDLVTSRFSDRRERRVVGRLGEGNDQFALVEVDRKREVLACKSGGDQRRRILVDGRFEKVDEANAHVLRKGGSEIFAPDEPALEQDRRQRRLLLLGLVERVLEIVT